MLDDAGREIRPWMFDSAAEFGAAGNETVAMTIDPLGSITPDGYIYGALVARGVQGTKLWTNTDADWSKTATVTPTAYGLWSGQDLAATFQDLAFVGIDNTAMTSVWFEGDMFLSPGETYKIAGDDTAFMYVDLGTVFQKLIHNGAADVAVTTAGWYPVRIGWADGNNSGNLDFTVNPGGGFENIGRLRLRATTSQLRGIFRTVFYRQVHGGGSDPRGPIKSVQDSALLATTTFDPPLPGSYTTNPPPAVPFDWSARWSGQFYAREAGSYTFRVASDDGNRITLGTQTSQQAWTRDTSGAVMTDLTTDLAWGWNDLVVDYNHVDGGPTLAVSVVSAPGADAVLAGAAIPKERLRPVEPRGQRQIHRTNENTVTIQDNAATTYAELTTNVAAMPGEQVAAIAITARVITQSPNQLQYRLTAPNNTTATPALTIRPDPNGGNSYIVSGVSTLTAGSSPEGVWKFGISDNSGSGSTGNSSYVELHLTFHTTGGREQIATKSLWRSPIVENQTDVVLIDHVRWTERAPAGSSVAMKIRTCTMASCADGVWSEPLTNGAAPTPTPGRYIQLQVEMTSAGTAEPEVDKIDAQYRTAPMK